MVGMTLQDRLITESLWARMADAAPDKPSLEGEASCEVAVVGAGLMGLSAALHLADLGASVIVLDAARPGWGGSGRNGGQVNPGLKVDPAEMIRRFGEEKGRTLIEFGAATADETFAAIRKYGIACDASQNGWLQLAHCDKALGPLERRAAEWQKYGVDIQVLSPVQTTELVGSEAYAGGILHPRGGSLHPLKLVHGLMRSAVDRGASVFSRSPVRRLEQAGGRQVLTTPYGRVLADRVLLATNAYTDGLVPQLKRNILPVSTCQIASEPLEPRLAQSILRQGHHASDTHRSLYYFRKDAEHRFLIGGSGAYSTAALAGVYAKLEQIAGRIYPELRGIRWQHRWGGMVAVTEDHLPRFIEPNPGVLAAIGFNGRGIALSVSLGLHLARRLLGGSDRDLLFPISGLDPIGFHPLKRAMLPLIADFYGILDRIDGGKVA